MWIPATRLLPTVTPTVMSFIGLDVQIFSVTTGDGHNITGLRLYSGGNMLLLIIPR